MLTKLLINFQTKKSRYAIGIFLLGNLGFLAGCTVVSPGNNVIVYKSDQSRQCENDGIPTDVMRRELTEAGIDVLCMEKNNNGMMQAFVCGNATGAINVYTIHGDDIADAKALGFAPISELNDYPGGSCSQNISPTQKKNY